MKDYVWRVGVSISVLLNVILGGSPDQSFSARNYEWKRQGRFNLVWLIDLVFRSALREDSHCLESWSYWKIRVTKLHKNRT